MSLTDREVVERERICITNVECANHTKCESGQGLGGSHLKSCNNDGALEIELAEIFIFICFAFCFLSPHRCCLKKATCDFFMYELNGFVCLC